MKNIIIIIAVFLVTTSCSEDFINLTPFSQANADDFYKTANDFENAVNAAYDVLQDGRLYGDRFEFLLEVRSDNGEFNDPASNVGVPFNIDKFQVRADNSWVEGAYDALYDGVNRCNIVLGRIENADFDAALANRLKGETQFLRALYYFHLVQLYGNVPLITTELLPSETSNVKRDPITEIYTQIETDLKVASSFLPISYSQDNLGRATQGAAYGLLAKVYLTQNKFSLAKIELEKVINLNTYSLLPSVSAVFSPSNEMNAEILFAVRYKKGEGGEGLSLTFNYTQNPTVSTDLINAYDLLDERLPLAQYVTVSGDLRVPQKYFDVLSTSNNVGNDIIVLRYADILLMYAEVLNEEGYVAADDSPAFQSLNTVRERAGLLPLTTIELADQTTFRTAVLKERRLELALEFHRWYDLKRTNTAISTFAALGTTVPECRLIYPIPQDEIDIVADLVRFPQNDCY
ncbi:RagB/SusD family nutrient uptake outer membrane protein [uncultured Polaribacter sp.]|uniref:RagB/SusD family nutrient uptake outer membrane protein n=1 Tax=uncultured Polaribacter sp. TaxID=174711 RepID=UPI0026140014|nr:RagB/SusD family nutrient uptake outer membrane protein [uncultured Polaribacter sp.]